jgi:beta-galactosidase
MVRIGVLDAQGKEVPTADNLVSLTIQGEGRLIGVGNGDPNCHESDKGSKRSLFQGLAQAIVQSAKEPGGVLLTADSDGLRSAQINIKTEKVVLSPEVT